MLGTGSGSIDIMFVFDFIILVYGAYSMYTAKKMRIDGQPPQWLVTADELLRIRKPKEFCEYMVSKTFIFGLMCVLYGFYGLVECFFLKNQIAEIAGIVFFVIVIVWFVMNLRKAKREFI